ncbi:PPE domain-containing protein [Mycobacterium sp. TY815]|uniref:PPE domain-containing protein n=1 Tax=Mycobacterium sp. TY815 TaxID=3050581 RepID=UPI0027423E37|nr:PPE domain-containing protein [Mycobacterium sp. TY815]MDP7707483.1 PPE domain-containing protein [Mycobacterium sp. TY815]
MAVVEVNREGLTAAGKELGAANQAYAPALAVPPGEDLTSVSAAESLNALSRALAARLDHGSILRELGAQAVIHTAMTLSGQDDANAAAITNGAPVGELAGALMSVPTVPAPAPPAIPAIPGALTPLPGEAHAKLLYAGPGAGSVREFADAWSNYGEHLQALAETLNGVAGSINDSWDRGQQQAGVNTQRHGYWVAEMSQHAHDLAGYARSVAAGFDTARSSTPGPEEFTQTRKQLQQAVQRFRATKGANAAEVQHFTQRYANLQAEATQAALDYHAHVTSASFGIGEVKDAPAITGSGPAVPLNSGPWKPGDRRHIPYNAGPGGRPPSNWVDSPTWIEIGPGSGQFVRADELPGVVVLKPGELGPPGYYGGGDSPNHYIELAPHSGVWVPQESFPDRIVVKPGELPPPFYQEYLPGSGMYLPSKDLTVDPFTKLDPNRTFPS